MEEPYLTRLNYLVVAWPSVYERIDKCQIQVMNFSKKKEEKEP